MLRHRSLVPSVTTVAAVTAVPAAVLAGLVLRLILRLVLRRRLDGRTGRFRLRLRRDR
ncbi:hypothetical protein [Streptomyces virginiae]|uniref:hypothetical protein n=1 Tax=Streptomyces virginiae TaxID=1961 RepID=UPI002DB580B9|nr:hypothetical protein [Streptomyces sp. CMAA1738]MEC4570905.1 hypothetical protein [Streptomyces sp. CMAA1738]